MAEIENLIDLFPLMRGLAPDDVARAEEHMYEMHVQPQEVIFNEGDEGNFMCFIINGQLDVRKKSVSGETVIIASVIRGESVGEMAVLQNTTRSASVIAASEATLLVLTSKGFDLLVDQHPRVGSSLLRGLAILLSKQLRETSADLADLMKPVDV